MIRSPGLWLYLNLVARRRGAALQAGAPGLPALPPPASGAVAGDTIWLHAGHGSALPSLAQLSQKLVAARPGLGFLLTAEGAAPPTTGFPAATLALPLPADRRPDIRALLDHARPALVFLTGLALPAALIHEAWARGVPLVLADVKLSAATRRKPWRWTKRMAAALLSRFDRVLVRDGASAAALRRLSSARLRPEVTGAIEETTEPLPYSETERSSLAQGLVARPVWLAVGCPLVELQPVLAAQLQALRLAHRILLIIAPAELSDGAEMARVATDLGLTVAMRSREEEPEEEVQVFVADGGGGGGGELGLWYRLSPVCYMGGSLSAGGSGRSPIEPAALGSAILHGPNVGPYPDAYARLAEARATRAVADAGQLSAAVSDVISPDRAALLAHNAWAASSGGAEVTQRIIDMLFADIDAAKARA